MEVDTVITAIRDLASDWGIVSVNLTLAVISATAAVSAARSARAALRRERPIFEVVREPDFPWTGWTGIQLYVTNPSPADIIIEEISVPYGGAGRIEIVQRLMETEVELVRGWISKDLTEQRRSTLPKTAPDASVARRITGLQIRVATFSGRKTLIKITSLPDKYGKPIVPSAIHIKYRWRDQRNRLMTVKAHT